MYFCNVLIRSIFTFVNTCTVVWALSASVNPHMYTITSPHLVSVGVGLLRRSRGRGGRTAFTLDVKMERERLETIRRKEREERESETEWKPVSSINIHLRHQLFTFGVLMRRSCCAGVALQRKETNNTEARTLNKFGKPTHTHTHKSTTLCSYKIYKHNIVF